MNTNDRRSPIRRRLFAVAFVCAVAATASASIGSADARSSGVPSEQQIKAAVDTAYAATRGIKEGKNADYIAALAALPPDLFGIAMALMLTTGLYETSGAWSWNVWLPAKSGVGGGIVAVAPGKFATATFAPPLDAAGRARGRSRAS